MKPYANLIMRFLAESLKERGGSGRRLSKIHLALGMPDEVSFGQSIRFLVATGRCKFVVFDEFNYVYLVPR